MFKVIMRTIHQLCRISKNFVSPHGSQGAVLKINLFLVNFVFDKDVPDIDMLCSFRIGYFAIFSMIVALLLSWYNMLDVITYPWYSKKYLVHNIWCSASSTLMSSVSVELFAFNFCLHEKLITDPLPKVIIVPVWPWQSCMA